MIIAATINLKIIAENGPIIVFLRYIRQANRYRLSPAVETAAVVLQQYNLQRTCQAEKVFFRIWLFRLDSGKVKYFYSLMYLRKKNRS